MDRVVGDEAGDVDGVGGAAVVGAAAAADVSNSRSPPDRKDDTERTKYKTASCLVGNLHTC